MGTPLPANEPGVLCGTCFSAGRPLEGIAPKYVVVDFIDCQPGPGIDTIQGIIPHGKWLLVNSSSCTYRVVYPLWIITVVWGTFSTLVRWRDANGALLFNSSLNFLQCVIDVDNLISFGFFIPVFGGRAEIRWSQEGL